MNKMEETKVSKSRSVAPVDWYALKTEFINGHMSAPALAQARSVSVSTLKQRAAREGWHDERRRLGLAVTETAQGVITEQRLTDLQEFNSADLEVARALRSMIRTRLVRVEQEGAPALTATELSSLSATAERVQKIGRLAMGATTENAGIGGIGGGPVAWATVPLDVYLKAREQALRDF